MGESFATGPEAVDALPGSIRVGAFDFTIEVWNAMRAAGVQRYGECSTTELRIAIQRDLPAAAKAADTLVHEALHAIWWTYGIRDEDVEERTVGMTATALIALYRDNPWLPLWLARCTA